MPNTDPFSGFNDDGNVGSFIQPPAPGSLSVTAQRRRSRELQNKQAQQQQVRSDNAQSSIPFPSSTTSAAFSNATQHGTDPFAGMTFQSQPNNQNEQQQSKPFDPFAGFGNSNGGF